MYLSVPSVPLWWTSWSGERPPITGRTMMAHADPGPRAWRFIRDDPAPGAWNMAVDEALMESVRAGAAPALRLYGWSPPCLSFGRNQPAAGRYDRDHLRAAGVDVVRRATGGRAVLHDEELTYSVVLPDRALGGPRRAYERVNRVLAAALDGLGAAVTVQADDGRAAPVPSTVPCFAEPVSGEILVAGRKLVGSAQVRKRGVLVQHGSIPLRPSALAAELERRQIVDSGSPADIQTAVGRPISLNEVIAAIRDAWTAGIGPSVTATLDPAEHRRAKDLSRDYLDDGWTWRR